MKSHIWIGLCSYAIEIGKILFSEDSWDDENFTFIINQLFAIPWTTIHKLIKKSGRGWFPTITMFTWFPLFSNFLFFSYSKTWILRFGSSTDLITCESELSQSQGYFPSIWKNSYPGSSISASPTQWLALVTVKSVPITIRRTTC